MEIVTESNIVASSFLTIPQSLTDPQKIGSCITYFRRYTLKSLLAISEVDDDGNLAAKPAPVEVIKKPVLNDSQFEKMLALPTKELKEAIGNVTLTDEQLTVANEKLKA